MAIGHIHFVHGFLGEPSDWGSVIKVLSFGGTTHCHSLIDDFEKLGEKRDFNSWVKMKKQELNVLKGPHLFVGYSLGGRLLMHWELDENDKVLLIGSHLGLLEGKEKRAQQDQAWIEKGHTLSRDEWFAEWNRQDVFSQDQNRPFRNYTKEKFSQWLEILSEWSLAKQESREDWIVNHSSQIYWCCGERDKKFEQLKNRRLQSILPSTHLASIQNAGHGVIFDAPGEVAKLVDEVL